MVLPVALVATAAAVGTLTALGAVRRTVARGERRLEAARRAHAAEAASGRGGCEPDDEDVYELEHDAETDTYRLAASGPNATSG